jgi:hypothetical protein
MIVKPRSSLRYVGGHETLWLGVACGVLLLVHALLLSAAVAEEQEPQRAATAVHLQIDYGSGFQKVYSPIPWRDGLTVPEMMQHAAQHAHPTKFTTRGAGATAFLSQIDEVQNEGHGHKNWIFYINGKIGEASFGTAKLAAGDTVLWRYQQFP